MEWEGHLYRNHSSSALVEEHGGSKLYFIPLLPFCLYCSNYLRITFYRSHQRKLSLLVKERTLQLEEVAAALEEKQEEINAQNEELMTQRDELENANQILTSQKHQILDQNKELDDHRNRLEYLVEKRTKELDPGQGQGRGIGPA